MAKNIDEITRTVTTPDGTERYAGRDGTGDFKVTGNNLLSDVTTDITALEVRQAGVYRNAIINGHPIVAQRGTSFAAMADGTFMVDRFGYYKTGAMVHTGTQDTTVPTSEVYQKSLKIDCTTIDASIAAGDYCYISQKIEGYNFAPYIGKTATLSFWTEHTKTGIYCVAFKNSGSDRTYVVEYTQSVASTEQLQTIPIPFTYTGGTWDYTNGTGIEVIFVIASGSTFQTTAGAWQSGDYLATSNQVNACDSTANDFIITGVQLNLGASVLPFEHLNYADELQRCQRYYEIGAARFNAQGACSYGSVFCAFVVTKRVAPSGAVFDSVGTVSKMDSDASKLAATVITVVNGITCYFNNQAIAVNSGNSGTWTADAEL